MKSEHRPRLGYKAYAVQIASNLGFTLDEIISNDRTMRCSRVRKILIKELNAYGLNVSGIARLLNRNHATILYYLRPCPSKINRRKAKTK